MSDEISHTARLELLFSRYNREVRRYIGRHLTSQADVDDCTQETFLSMWRQESRGNLLDDPRGYLFTTALNAVRALRRRDRVRKKNDHTELSEEVGALHSIENEKSLAER